MLQSMTLSSLGFDGSNTTLKLLENATVDYDFKARNPQTKHAFEA